VQYPLSEGELVSVRWINRHQPDRDIQRFLNGIGDQLKTAGIGFEHTSLPHDY
jgi:hypothetical protein